MLASEFSSGLEHLQSFSEDSISASFNKDRDKVKNAKRSGEDNTPKPRNAPRLSFTDGYKPPLFRNNPAIPSIANDKNVESIKEPLFCDKLFKNMTDLHPHMIANLEQTLSITKVTAIQDKTISVIKCGKDALVRSQTGSGKTLAYAIPIVEELHKIRPKICRTDGLRAFIILPTRELALQTYECFIKLVKPYTWLVPGLLVGGEKRKSEKARLRKGITILIGTPGRLLDHANNTQSISFEHVSWLIIDEADRLLDLGYEKDITRLIEILDKQCGGTRQTVLLSATLTPAVKRLAGLSMKDPIHIDALSEPIPVSEENAFVIPEQLCQHYIVVPPKLRLVTLAAMLLGKCSDEENKGKIIVFVGTQAMVDFHTELLSTIFSDINFYKLHGNMTQVERTHVFQSYKSSNNGVLFCSDVGARGLDLPQVDWIIQYTAPTTISDYVHRVGRTARVGLKGSAFLFLAPHEVGFVQKLQAHRLKMKQMKVEQCLTSLTKLNFDQSDVRNIESAATTLQIRCENAVADQELLHSLGCQAYMSWARFYATYPKDVRDVFSYKELHLGHYAKSFALRDAPKTIGGIGRPRNLENTNFKQTRLEKRKFTSKKNPDTENFSEFGSGLKMKGKEFDSGLKIKWKKT